jgi:type VI secretion system protein
VSGLSLYDILTGYLGDDPVDTYDEKTQEIISVMENIKRILNSRAGALKHLPEYGLPDLSHIYRNLPASTHQLKEQMENTLLIYEPRLRSVDIEVSDDPDHTMVASYYLTCHLKRAGLVRYGTYFSPEGLTLMRWRKRADA